MKFTTKEVIFMTGINATTLNDLTRAKFYTRTPARFTPDYPSGVSGQPVYFSMRDVAAITKYVEIRKQIVELQNMSQRILKKEET